MMSKEERERLIEKSKENEKIRKALAEHKRIIAAKPIHHVPNDPRLMNMKKKDAVKLIAQYNENIAKAEGLLETMKEPVKVAAPIVEEKEESVSKKTKKKGYSKKVE